MHLAALYGRRDCAQMLIGLGSDVGAQDSVRSCGVTMQLPGCRISTLKMFCALSNNEWAQSDEVLLWSIAHANKNSRFRRAHASPTLPPPLQAGHTAVEVLQLSVEETKGFFAGAVAVAAQRSSQCGTSDEDCVHPAIVRLEAAVAAVTNGSGCPFSRLSALRCRGTRQGLALAAPPAQQAPLGAAIPEPAAVSALALARLVRRAAAEGVLEATIRMVAALEATVATASEPAKVGLYAVCCVRKRAELQDALAAAVTEEARAEAALVAERARRRAVHAQVVTAVAAHAARILP